MKHNKTTSFLDYQIIECTNGDGIVLKKDTPNLSYECHLGNYSSVEDAQVAGIFFFMVARPAQFATHLFHYTTGSATTHEYFKFAEVLKKEGIKMPEEIGCSTCMSALLTFKGKLFEKVIRERDSNRKTMTR